MRRRRRRRICCRHGSIEEVSLGFMGCSRGYVPGSPWWDVEIDGREKVLTLKTWSGDTFNKRIKVIPEI